MKKVFLVFIATIGLGICVNAQRLSDAELQAAIKVLRKFEELHILHETNKMEFSRQFDLMSEPEKEVLMQFAETLGKMQSYSPQPSQSYRHQPQHSQDYSNVQRNDGSWAIHDNNSRFVTSGRFEAVDNDYFNVLRRDGSWAVHDKNMRFVTSGRATKNSAGTYNVQRNDGSFAVHDRNMRFQTSGRVN